MKTSVEQTSTPSQTSSAVADLLELQKVALSNMARTTNQTLGATFKGPPSSADETDLLELQKVAMASIKKLSEKVLSRSATPISGPMQPPSAVARGDLLELQRTALENMQNFQKEPSPHPTPSTLHTTVARLPQQAAGECDLLERQKVALRGIKTELVPRPVQVTGDSSAMEEATLTAGGKGNEFAPKLTPTIQQAGGDDFSEVQKVAWRSIPKLPSQPVEGGDDLFESQKLVLKPTSNQGAPPPPPAVAPSKPIGGEDLLELQKLALWSVQKQTALASAPQQVDRGPDSPTSVQSKITPIQIWQQGGGDLSELQKAALTPLSFDKWEGGIVVAPKEKELKQPYNTQAGTSPTSSPTTFDKLPTKEALEILSQELSRKDQALQSANRTIEERDQLLLEYEGSLANALNLLQSMNVQCVDARAKTTKVLIEAEEIYGNLRVACSTMENFDGSIPTCAKGLQFSDGPSTIFVADNTKFVFGLEDGLGGSEVETDEHKNSVEELLRELHNIEVARKEAQEGCLLQIQRNEQLIAELQQLDTGPPIFKGATCDCVHVDHKPLQIASPHENEVVNTQHSQLMSRNESPSDQAKESLCDHAYKKPSDDTKGHGCVHIYEDPRDQASGKTCLHVYEITSCQVNDDLGEKAKKTCEHAYEGHPSDAKANEKPCDHVYESHPSDDKATKNPCDHVYGSRSDHAMETPCDHVYENQIDHAHGNSCNHLYGKPGDPPSENRCDHADKNPHDHSDEIHCHHAYEDGKDCGPLHAWEDIGSATFNAPTWMGQLPKSSSVPEVKVSAELRSMESARKHSSHKYVTRTSSPNALWEHLQNFVKKKRDPAIQSSSSLSCENPSDPTSDIPVDYAYEDGKDCGPLHEWENIGSATFTAPTWMGVLPKSSTVPELKASAELKPVESVHLYKTHKYVARTFSPNALWEHLQHFVKKMQPQACDDVEKIQFSRQLVKLQGDWDLRAQELQSHLEHKTREIRELHEQISQLQTALVEEQGNRGQTLPQETNDAPKGPTKADLEHKDRVIHKMHFQMHQLEAALRQEREDMREALVEKTNQLEAALHQEREEMRKALVQQTIEMSRAPAAVLVDPDGRAKEINELKQQLHQLQKELDEKKSNLTPLVKTEMDNLQASLHARDENVRELQETVLRKEAAWQAEKHQLMNCIDALETKLLVKEEEVIKLTYELETSRAPPDDVKFKKGENIKEGSHFFHKQGEVEEGREILDLRCEVFSLQDCLGIKTQTIKTMEKELGRSYNIVTGLRSKVRALQECERIAQRQGQNKELIERLRSTEEKLKKSLGERAVMSNKIQDLATRCKYLEDLEHLHREGSDDMKSQAIKELEKELERNVQIIKSLQAQCNEYDSRAKQAEARKMSESTGRSSDSGTYDSWEQDHTKLAQLSDEKEALAAECEQLQSQVKRKDQVIIQLQGDVQNLKRNQNSSSPVQYHESELAVSSNDGRSKNSKATNTLSENSVPEHGKVESQEVSTLRELLREQWQVQKVMGDRLNTMMAYVSDRVDEFEMSPSDTTSDASFAPPKTNLNHFHVEAKLMKLQLEQQLQVLRGQVIASLPASGMTSPGEQRPQMCLSTQNKQLLSEKNALEDSAQTLQEKTSRLLNKLTFMRTEYGPSFR